MTKRLERDQENVVVSGVVAGLARYFEQDPKLFRLFAIVFLIVTGFFPGVLIYFVAWLMMPKSIRKAQGVDYEVVD
ncbi:MAG: PspC domain-containing protein [Patescibacteria group bacterium]